MSKIIKIIFNFLSVLFCLITYSNLFSNNAIGLVSPVNGYQHPALTVTFKWNKSLNIDSYRLIVAKDNLFTNKIYDISVTGTDKTITFDTSITNVYWKVLSNDNYIKGNSQVYQLSIFTPELLNDVLLWLSADKNTIINPSDSSISEWKDRTNNQLDAVQPDISSQPKLKLGPNTIGSKPVVRLDGINDFLLINSGGDVGSVYALFNYNSSSTFPNFNGLLTHQSGGENGIIFIGTGGSTGFYLNNSTCFNRVFLNKNNINNFSPLNNFKVVSSYKLTLPTTFSNFIIGRERADNNRLWNGDVAEIILSKNNSADQFDIIHQYLYNKYAPPITIKDTILGNSFCSPVSVSAPNNYITYLWSNGATTPTVSLTPDKEYSVTVKDIFGQESTTSFIVFPYSRLNNKTVYICKGDTFKVDLKTPPGFSILWNTGAITPQLNITQTGQYRVRVTDASSCFVFDTINVIVDEPTLSPVPDAGNNLTLCEGEKLFLTTATAFDSILWSNGSTENFIAVTNPGNYNVYGITNSGCVINQSFNITIAGKAPVAQFAVPPACQDAPLTFTDTSKVPAGNTIQNWSWTFSNNSTSTIQNPTTLFSSLGTQTVSLKITTNVGCTDSIAKTFTVNRKPIPSFFNLLSCAGNPTTFVDQSVANAASIVDWRWDFAGLGTINGIQNPNFRFPDATNYSVKLVATNSNFCSDSISLPLAVNPSPVAEFSFDSVCGRSPISYKFLATVTSPSTITAWNWDFGDGEGETAIRNPQHAYDEPGIYEVSLAVRSSNQCSDTIVKSVRIFDFPTVDFEVSSAQCVGKEIQFTDISTTPDGSDITKWTWYFAGLATSSQQNPRYKFNTEGNYTVQLTATNEVGCSGTKQRSVAVSSLPQPKFTFTPANGLPPLNVSFTNQSPVSGSYVWDYGDGTAPVAAYNPPAHIYTVKGSYPIKLIGTDFRGCVDTLTRYILVDKAYLDGVIAAVILIPNGNFYKVQVTLQNNSNIEITSAGLGLQLGGGAILRETWNGSLLPGRSATFLFTGEVSAGEAQAPVICATIENLNSYAPEDRTDNNTTCKELSVGDFEVFSIYPNPALENINLGVMLPQDGTVSIRLIDYLGQQLNMITFSGIKGYNNFTVNTAALGASVYIAEVAYKDQIIRKKFVRGNSK